MDSSHKVGKDTMGVVAILRSASPLYEKAGGYFKP